MANMFKKFENGKEQMENSFETRKKWTDFDQSNT